MAVEFALVAPIFIAVLIAVLQTSIYLFAQQVLQNAALEAGRLFMTGSAQNSSLTQAQFQNKVCPMIQALFNCGNLIVIVQSYDNFSSASTSAPTLYTNGVLNTNWTYDPGTPGQVMVVQLVYQWSVVGGPLGFVLSNLPNSAAEMMGVSAFRVEPYNSSSSSSGSSSSGSTSSGSSGSGSSGSGSGSGSGSSGSGGSGSSCTGWWCWWSGWF